MRKILAISLFFVCAQMDLKGMRVEDVRKERGKKEKGVDADNVADSNETNKKQKTGGSSNERRKDSYRYPKYTGGCLGICH